MCKITVPKYQKMILLNLFFFILYYIQLIFTNNKLRKTKYKLLKMNFFCLIINTTKKITQKKFLLQYKSI